VILDASPAVTPLTFSLSSAESTESTVQTEQEDKSDEMRMIEDPVLTLCHFPSPGSNQPEKKKPRLLPTVSLSLLCFSDPVPTTPPQSPRSRGSPHPNFPDDGALFEKPSLKSFLDRFEKIEESLNTPITGAEGLGFFGSTTVPLLDPPPIGELTSYLPLKN